MNGRLNPNPGGAPPSQLSPIQPLRLPTNLAEWCGTQKLVEWIQEEVQKLEWQQHWAQLDRKFPDYRPKVAVAVLAYACATWVFGSEEIVRACHADPNLQRFCEGKIPFDEELDHFRRVNRTLLEDLLTAVFVRAVAEKSNVDLEAFPPVMKQYLHSRAVERVDIVRHVDTWDE